MLNINIMLSRHALRAMRLHIVLLLALYCNPATSLAETTTILAFGDSLTAGLGVAPEEAFPVRLQAKLQQMGIDARVENAGVSGDTTTGGRARLDWVLGSMSDGPPQLVIIELGANDALRGVDPAIARVNMDVILATLASRGIPALLTGMLAPPNLGSEYGVEFNSIFPDLAAKYGVVLYPFFLEGVAAIPELNQDDLLHPTAAGVDIIVEGIAPYVVEALRERGE